uniref:Uncharacterized protein n=1 Tax=Calidris pygmaea TaxID=425635 RepID=A0A8C3JMW1_9CHAR
LARSTFSPLSLSPSPTPLAGAQVTTRGGEETCKAWKSPAGTTGRSRGSRRCKYPKAMANTPKPWLTRSVKAEGRWKPQRCQLCPIAPAAFAASSAGEGTVATVLVLLPTWLVLVRCPEQKGRWCLSSLLVPRDGSESWAEGSSEGGSVSESP